MTQMQYALFSETDLVRSALMEVNVSQRSESIAAGLRARRAIKKVTQREAAKAIGANQATLSGWENNAGIGLEDAWAAADYYGCSLDELAGRPWPPREVA